MSSTRLLTRSFAAGEIAPELYGRLDLDKFQTGLAATLNVRTLPHGPAEQRPGFAFVNEVKTSAKRTRIIPFSFNTTQTYILEMGDAYIRVHTQGATLLSGTSKNITGITQANPGVVTSVGHGYANGQWLYLQAIGGMTRLNGRWVKVAGATANTYQLTDLGGANIDTTGYSAYTAGGTSTPPVEVTSPFLEADLFDVKITQSADVLTLVHPNYAPQEFKRTSATTFTLGAISFSPTIAAPAAPTVTPTGAGAKTYTYVTTAIAADTLEESLASAATSTTNDLTVAGNSNAITPAAVSGAVRYNIYKLLNGLYGYIGQTDGSALTDANITPDVSKTPAIPNTPFASASNYPGAVGYYEGRRAFAGTDNKPQNYWLTRSGTESNLSYSIPTRDDDAIAQRILAAEVNRIRHIVPAGVLLMLTSGGVWKVAPRNSDILTPTSAAPKLESNDGASNVAPIITGQEVLFSQDATFRVRELKYTAQNGVATFVSTDISVLAPHLFDDYTGVDSAYVRSPHKMAWFTRSDGRLLGLTYLPEHNVAAWHQHATTNGTFESVAAVKEGTEYPLYAVVKRTINGRTVRYIERMAKRSSTTQAGYFFVDSGVSYSGSPITTINTGLWHLEGQTLSVLADGAEHPPVTVAGGAVTLSFSASVVQIGLPMTAQMQLLPPGIEAAQAFGQGNKVNVTQLWLRVLNTMTVKAGPSFSKLREYPARTAEDYDTPAALKTGKIHIVLDNKWGDTAGICVQNDRPMPLTILSMTQEVEVGG